MNRTCKYCKNHTPDYTHGCGWCNKNKHIVTDNYSCCSFQYIECCETCHYYHDGCVKEHETLYTDRCMCRDEYEERIEL